ncbi:MAG: hypothetical protein JW901_05090 [Dehalococcoidia bacterium]|nr:hypothetical protein [Dehalococcoidia bacterium]
MIITIPLVIVSAILAWLLRPAKNMAIPRKVAILSTVIPILVIAIVAVIFQILHNMAGMTWVSSISNTCFIIAIGLIGAAILAVVGFVITRKWEIAKGIGFGICIGIIISIIEFGVLEWLAGV